MNRIAQLSSPADAKARAPKMRARLASSASGYVLVRRFSARDRAALAVLMDAGEAEVFDSPTGRAYRLKKKTP